MNLLKKIARIFLILLAVVFSLSILGSTINAIEKSIEKIKESAVFGLGYALGSLLVIVIFVVIIYFMLKFGLKLIKKKTVVIESIDEIGTDDMTIKNQ